MECTSYRDENNWTKVNTFYLIVHSVVLIHGAYDQDHVVFQETYIFYFSVTTYVRIACKLPTL